jgi:hypothetical protein
MKRLLLLIALPLALLAPAALGGCRRAPPPLPPAPPASPPALCNTIPNDAKPVPYTPKAGPLPAFAGGPIEDGLYRATRAEGYGDVDPNGRRMTLAVSGGGTELAWSGEMLDAAGVTSLATLRANARATATGSRLDLTTTCSSRSPSPIPARLSYTARPGTLVLGLVDAGGDFVTTYERVPDAPR